jgi:hypothetical protein
MRVLAGDQRKGTQYTGAVCAGSSTDDVSYEVHGWALDRVHEVES